MNRKCSASLLVYLIALMFGCAEREAEESGLPGEKDYLNRPIVEVLPDVERIKQVEVYGMLDEDYKQMDRFQVPEKYWHEILQAMKPARFDTAGIHWQMLGYMDVQMMPEKGEDKVDVVRLHLYNTYEDDGAFSIEKNKYDRPYYRGGNSQALSRVLHKAYVERETQKTAK